ncbi:peroxisomal sarcosine oxidase-like [Ciona intestinalis]
MEEFEVIVIGAGIIGSWTAYHLAKHGRSTLLLEQFTIPHTRGSSHGHSRILRQSYVDEHYAAMMPESYQLWKDMETFSGNLLLKHTGHLSISKKEYGHVAKVRSICDKLNIPYLTLDSEALNTRFGIKFDEKYDFVGTYQGHKTLKWYAVRKRLRTTALLDPSGAVLDADKCISSVQGAVKTVGGVVRDQEKVLNIDPVNEDTVHVRTNKSVYKCRSVVLTCGPWANEVLKPLDLQLPLEVSKVLVTYWKERQIGAFSSNSGFPNMICYTKEGIYIYGFPSDEYPGLFKLCYHHHFPIDPNERDKLQSPKENEKQQKRTDELKQRIKIHFPLLEEEIGLVETCIVTDTPDGDYVLDCHPMYRNIIIAAGMSG